MAKNYFTTLDSAGYEAGDWDEAKKFYSEKLGIPIAFESEELQYMEFGSLDTSRIGISIVEGKTHAKQSPGGATALFIVANVEETIKDLKSRGVNCDDVLDLGDVKLGAVYDPWGNKLNFAEG